MYLRESAVELRATIKVWKAAAAAAAAAVDLNA